MVKISDFPEGTTPAAADLVPYVDVSDPTEAPSGTTKHVTMSDFFAFPVALDDGAGVEGDLPLSHLAFPVQVSFQMAGAVEVASGETIWVCEFPQAQVIGVRASLGRNGTATTTPVIVDVLRGTVDPVPTFTTIFPTTANPQVDVAENVGDRVVPDVTDLSRGESLVINVDQSDEDAADLLVNVYMLAFGFPTTSFVPTEVAAPDGNF